MAHTSPATYLAWSILSTLLGVFLFFHLWNFDRFKCLKWNHGPYSGAFKRIMTYTYIITIPCVMAFSIGFAVIKYNVGYSFVPGFGIIPTPWQLWPKSYQHAIFPLQLLFSIGWGLEMVTHLEELCFWLFLVNSGSVQQDWFRSLYFKTWIIGAVVAIIYMPLVTIFTRSDPLKCEAFSFLAGSLGSLSLTLWFTPILWTFPKFLNGLKREGVDMNTVVRLTTFYELNSIRVVFRLLFVVPLLILGVDGVRPHHHINESGFATEFCAILSAIGCVISSGITLIIFFPRSIAGEIAAKQASKDMKSQHLRTFHSTHHSDHIISYGRSSPLDTNVKGIGLTSIDEYPATLNCGTPSMYKVPPSMYIGPESPTSLKTTSPFHDPEPLQTQKDSDNVVTMFAPNRRDRAGGIIEGGVTVVNLTEQNLASHDHGMTSVHPFIHNFTSPIDLMQGNGHSYGTKGSRARYR